MFYNSGRRGRIVKRSIIFFLHILYNVRHNAIYNVTIEI